MVQLHKQLSKLKFKIPDSHWTIVAGIGVKHPAIKEYEIVAIGAGLKCLPFNEYSRDQLFHGLVHDCHAEVLARRAFMRYLLGEMQLEKSSILEKNVGETKWKIRQGVSFHMYVSQAPCGDASMHAVKSNGDPEQTIDEWQPSKRSKLNSCGIRRGREDFGADLGLPRTKPGRADAPLALCMSCSDKIARWTILGVQGALLMNLLAEPVYLSSLTVADDFHRESLNRALNDRISKNLNLKSPYKSQRIQLYESSHLWEHRRAEGKSASFESFVWFKGMEKPEWIVKGRKKGSAPPKDDSLYLACQPAVSKEKILLELRKIIPDLAADYQTLKEHQREYQVAKAEFLDSDPFKSWIKSIPDDSNG